MSQFKNILALSIAETAQDSPYDMGNFKGTLKTAMDEVAEEQRKAAVEELKELLRRVQTAQHATREGIRAAKRNIKKMKERMDKTDRCLAYAQETNDFGPLLSDVHGDFSVREAGGNTEVPEDWKPSKDD